MSRIKSKDTEIERTMKRLFDKIGYAYKHHSKVPDSPDFLLCRRRIAIFCDGDFLHGYHYDKRKKPAKKFWRDKRGQHETG